MKTTVRTVDFFEKSTIQIQQLTEVVTNGMVRMLLTPALLDRVFTFLKFKREFTHPDHLETIEAIEGLLLAEVNDCLAEN